MRSLTLGVLVALFLGALVTVGVGVALAADATGPGSTACTQAAQDVVTAQTALNQAIAARDAVAKTDPKYAELQAKVDDAQTILDARKAAQAKACAPPTSAPPSSTTTSRPRLPGGFGNGTQACRDAQHNQLIARDELNAAIDRLNKVRNDAIADNGPGGPSITDDEQSRILAASAIENDRQADLTRATNERKKACSDNGGAESTPTVILLPPPPGITYTAPAPSSGGQVSQVPSGGVETGGWDAPVR